MAVKQKKRVVSAERKHCISEKKTKIKEVFISHKVFFMCNFFHSVGGECPELVGARTPNMVLRTGSFAARICLASMLYIFYMVALQQTRKKKSCGFVL